MPRNPDFYNIVKKPKENKYPSIPREKPCGYCGKQGHSINDCAKLDRDNAAKKAKLQLNKKK